jgi:hypothetical protein
VEVERRGARIGELQHFQHALLNSRSWRVTRPLRAVKQALTR